jgi:hypothetical protein
MTLLQQCIWPQSGVEYPQIWLLKEGQVTRHASFLRFPLRSKNTVFLLSAAQSMPRRGFPCRLSWNSWPFLGQSLLGPSPSCGTSCTGPSQCRSDAALHACTHHMVRGSCRSCKAPVGLLEGVHHWSVNINTQFAITYASEITDPWASALRSSRWLEIDNSSHVHVTGASAPDRIRIIVPVESARN